jgi:hypothetical protein
MNTTNTYKHEDGVLRRRKCFECGESFMTLEKKYTLPAKEKPHKPKPLMPKRDAAMIERLRAEIQLRDKE